MQGLSYLFLAVGLAADAFAVSVIRGMTASGRSMDSILTAMFFAAAQMIMPTAGYFLGMAAAGPAVRSGGSAVAAVILFLIGGKMLIEGAGEGEPAKTGGPAGVHLVILAAQAVATSIDAMAAGIGLYASGARLWTAVGTIGAVTGSICLAGHWLGRRCSAGRWGGYAQILGGLILIGLAIRTGW